MLINDVEKCCDNNIKLYNTRIIHLAKISGKLGNRKKEQIANKSIFLNEAISNENAALA